MLSVQRVLERVTELPLSPMAAKILELVRDERAGAREIADVVAQDQAFTARLLRIANSPYYGQSRTVTTVTQAVPVLGIDTISSLALALFSFGTLANDNNPVLTLRDLWEHSMGCAVWARRIARRIDHKAAEEAFIAGLLHDMGKTLFYRFFKNEFIAAVQYAKRDGVDLIEAERSILGTDHPTAGAAVARKWNLPAVLWHAVGYHHWPLALPEDVDPMIRKTVAIVHVADCLSDRYQIGYGVESDPQSIAAEVWNLLGIDLESAGALCDAVSGEVDTFRKMLDIAPGTSKETVRGVAHKGETLPSGRPVAPAAVKPEQPWPDAGSAPTLDDFAKVMDAGKRLALLAGLDALYPNIAAQMMAMVEADAAHVFVPRSTFLEAAGAAGFTVLSGRRFPLEPSLIGWVLRMGEAMVVEDIAKAHRSWEKDLFSAAGFKSHLIVPVEWAGQRLAVLCVSSRTIRRWTPRDIALVDIFVGFVAVALENARLYRDAEERAEALTAANQKLAEALRVKARFLATVSHELRSPLFVMNGYANLIAEQTLGPVAPEMRNAVDKIVLQGDMLMRLISNVLEISQMETGSLTVHLTPINFTEVLDEAAETMRQVVGKRKLVFAANYDHGRHLLVTDRGRVKQVLGQLLDNAAKFTPDGGKITLRSGIDERGAEIIVEDTGIGIDAAHQGMIFDGFRQIDDEDRRRYEGMGIGLVLSRRWIELLGGALTFESELGSGSRFRVWLPRGAGAQPTPLPLNDSHGVGIAPLDSTR